MEIDSAGGAGPSEPPASAHVAVGKKLATGAPKKLVIKAFKGASRRCKAAAKHSGAPQRAWRAIGALPLRVAARGDATRRLCALLTRPVLVPRAEKPKLPENFEADTWAKLQAAVHAVHAKEAVAFSYEQLYRVRAPRPPPRAPAAPPPKLGVVKRAASHAAAARRRVRRAARTWCCTSWALGCTPS